jgi:hypothetical protein
MSFGLKRFAIIIPLTQKALNKGCTGKIARYCAVKPLDKRQGQAVGTA